MSISFSGLASGLDTSGWVDALVSVKQEKITSLQVDLKAIQTMLGHSDISSTQVYMKFQNDNIKNVYKNSHPRA